MTDNNTLVDYDIKDFGKLSRHILHNLKVGFYQSSFKEDEKEGIKSVVSCPDRICIESGNDHGSRGSTTNLQEFVN
jgi:hypothetical protein